MAAYETIGVIPPLTGKPFLQDANPSFAFRPTLAEFYPSQFYLDRGGLEISESSLRFLTEAKPVKRLPAARGKCFDLTRDAPEDVIRGELPKGHEFEHSELLARLAELILHQPNYHGDLVKVHQMSNVFFSAGWAIDAMWLDGVVDRQGERWLIRGRRHSPGFRWRAGDRFFSAKSR